jgi:hypothetical protein
MNHGIHTTCSPHFDLSGDESRFTHTAQRFAQAFGALIPKSKLLRNIMLALASMPAPSLHTTATTQ